MMNLRCNGHLLHKWSAWSKPFRQKYNYFVNGRIVGDTWEMEQSRQCERCGRIQTKEV